MLLSRQQRYMLDIIRRLGCLRRDQLWIFTREHFREADYVMPARNIDVMLQQMRHRILELRMDGEIVRLSAVCTDPLRLEAIDVMLELSGGTPLDFNACLSPPELLQFVCGTEYVRRFTVADLDRTVLPRAAQPSERVIWLNASGRPPEGLNLPLKSFFAVRQTNGPHRFFGSGDISQTKKEEP